MTVLNYIWIASFLISLINSDSGTLGHPVDSLGFLSHVAKTTDESTKKVLRTGAHVRQWRRLDAEAHRESCEDLAAPWMENTQKPSEEEGATRLQLCVRPPSPGASRGLVFPGKSLFSLVRRVYSCCQEGTSCRNVKGIQGRFRSDAAVEFVLTREILSLPVLRAELHLQLSNPQHLDVQPIIPFVAKRNAPTRYSLGSVGTDTLELTVDLLFLFHHLQEVAGGVGRGPSLGTIRRVRIFSNEDLPGEKPSSGVLQDLHVDAWGEELLTTLPAVNLVLILSCSGAGRQVPCESSGVQLSHTPFMALYYR